MREDVELIPRTSAVVVLVLLACSVVCLAAAPLLMPDSYSVVENAVSESAAQGVEGAWLARFGFLFLGFGVLLLANLADSRWGPWGRIAFRAYGVAMICNAAFSHMPWEDVPYDAFEDSLHSISAFITGMSFIAGVLIVTFRRGPGHRVAHAYDVFALLAAIGISILMGNVETIAGLVQRMLFAIAFVWFASEAVRLTTPSMPTPETASREPIEAHSTGT